MYPNFGNQGRGNPAYTGSSSGSHSQGSTSNTQQEQKYTMAGSSQFVPSLNAITTNQDLQWLVQPSILHPPGPSRSPVPPYPTLSGARPLAPPPHFLRPGVIRAAAHTTASTRHRNDQHETDILEDEKSKLQKEIAELEKEKDKLELVLEAHRPICKIEESDSDSDLNPSISSLGGIKLEPHDFSRPGPSTRQPTKVEKPKPKITIPTKRETAADSSAASESESLHTPVLASTPSLTPFTAGMIFTYPSASLDTSASTTSHASSHHGNIHHSQVPQPCGIAHRRSSSSGDQSDHSLHSPTILTL
ncbi:hypothetical protein F7725_010328 [Dissostichus mawsoni]|uniref:Fos-related antigen 1 n=1 Tax=Dissostichus mawsoni TaxID=36200 RepID=A0A7J5XNI3_DISMA|nr:hypothetical protein F7725_010328 [Dissostichus mawsoni]